MDRAWQRMLSGQKLDLLNPSPDNIEILDIAHGLSRTSRWNGQTIGDYSYSVAQHSVLVTDLYVRNHPQANKVEILSALLHDASEYVVGDLISPFKNAVGHHYRRFEDNLLEAIFKKYDLPFPMSEQLKKDIKTADKMAAYIEGTSLAGFDRVEGKSLFYDWDDSVCVPKISCDPPVIAKQKFIDYFKKLS